MEGLLRASLWHPKRVRIQDSTDYYDDVVFISVLNQLLSSYIVRRQEKRKRQACTNSKEEDKGTLCCRTYIRDVKPRPLDLSNTYQQFEIIRKKYRGFYAKSRKLRASTLPFVPFSRAQLITLKPKFSAQYCGRKSYSPFVFVKEGHVEPNDQMKISTFYKITLEQRWDKIFGCQNVENEYSKVVVPLDVFVEREEVFVYGRKAVWEEKKLEDGVIWFKNCEGQNGDEKGVRVLRREEIRGTGTGWRDFGCFVLVERFVLTRMEGNVVLAYHFKHTRQIRCKWE
ncbi:hypothetical protein PanWU01x14_266170 [Parasponia andersonii]|uniref:Uncharacterized protein n=1 Tax=Parasponia andersonii TaxID=3476 RepID=A0A2P5B6W2_PARAD|nr:hypothetical protein PanWU01x14_266170 [Parasponia andersonii]